MKTTKSNGQLEAKSDPMTAELDQIKRLLLLLVMKAGASQFEVAKALGCSQSTISEKYGFGAVEPIKVRRVQ
jgi:DNA-directed RNA polymerase specialized sigma subunit